MTASRPQRPCRTRPLCMYRLLFANDFLHVLGSRSYVSGLLIDTRVVALLGLRSHRDLISGKVYGDRKGRQILGAYFSVPCFLSFANSFG